MPRTGHKAQSLKRGGHGHVRHLQAEMQDRAVLADVVQRVGNLSYVCRVTSMLWPNPSHPIEQDGGLPERKIV